MKKSFKKLSYSPPLIVANYEIEMEMGIAAGSLNVGSGDNNVQDEWDEDGQEFDFEWE